MRFTYEVIIDIPHPAMTNGEQWSAELARELRSTVARMSHITADSLTQVREMGYKASEPLTPGRTICGHCGKEVEGDPVLHQCPERIEAEAQSIPAGASVELEVIDRTPAARQVFTCCDTGMRSGGRAHDRNCKEFSPETSRTLVKSPGAELEPGIEVDARFRQMVETMKKRPRYGRCAACQERIEISDDPVETHHIIMRHRAETCKANAGMKWSPDEYAQAVTEFEAQPHIIELKRKIQMAHESETRRAESRERNLIAKLRDSWDKFIQEWRR